MRQFIIVWDMVRNELGEENENAFVCQPEKLETAVDEAIDRNLARKMTGGSRRSGFA